MAFGDDSIIALYAEMRKAKKIIIAKLGPLAMILYLHFMQKCRKQKKNIAK
jgi:hypothetical protein